MEKQFVILGIDIGGSHYGIGFLDLISSAILSTHHFDFDAYLSPEEIVLHITNSIKSVINENWSIVYGGVGCPGQSKNGVLVAAANLPTLKNFPLANKLSQNLNNIQILLLNDADAAIASELWSSETKSYYSNVQNACMITLGTGIGMGLILNGKLYRGTNGLIEGGHMMISTGGINLEDSEDSSPLYFRQCGCGQKDCVETYASAKNTAERLLAVDRSSSSTGTNGSTPLPPLGSKEVFQRAAQGDQSAKNVLTKSIQALALLCVNICRVLDPEVIILAGGMAQAGDSLLLPLKEEVKRITWTVLPTSVCIETSRSIGAAGIVGAALASHREFRVSVSPTTALSTTASSQKEPKTDQGPLTSKQELKNRLREKERITREKEYPPPPPSLDEPSLKLDDPLEESEKEPSSHRGRSYTLYFTSSSPSSILSRFSLYQSLAHYTSMLTPWLGSLAIRATRRRYRDRSPASSSTALTTLRAFGAMLFVQAVALTLTRALKHRLDTLRARKKK